MDTLCWPHIAYLNSIHPKGLAIYIYAKLAANPTRQQLWEHSTWVSLPEKDSAAQRRGQRARIGNIREGSWKEVETKVDLDYPGEAERTWPHSFKHKKEKAALAVSKVCFPERRAWDTDLDALWNCPPLQGKGAGLFSPIPGNHWLWMPLTSGGNLISKAELGSGGWVHWPGKGHLDGTPTDTYYEQQRQKCRSEHKIFMEQ